MSEGDVKMSLILSLLRAPLATHMQYQLVSYSVLHSHRVHFAVGPLM